MPGNCSFTTCLAFVANYSFLVDAVVIAVAQINSITVELMMAC